MSNDPKTPVFDGVAAVAAKTDAGHDAINTSALAQMMDAYTKMVTDKIEKLKSKGEQVSVGDMFDTQITVNKLSQMAEMSTQVLAASNTAIMSMARNMKQ